MLAFHFKASPASQGWPHAAQKLGLTGGVEPGLHPVTRGAPAASPPFSSAWLRRAPSPQFGFEAASGVLVDVDQREVLWARDPEAVRAPASLTKIVTAMVAADLAPLQRQVTVPEEAAGVEADSTVMGLSSGDVVTIGDLMYGVFLTSGNDAAETLARQLTSREHFIDLMNRKAAGLGMHKSHFTNPTGLDDPGQRTTAYDMAVAAAALTSRYPELLAIAGSRHAALPASSTHKAFDMYALNRLLGTYPGATGLKTGYTGDAGYCLVGTASRGDRHLVAVVMGDGLSLTADAVKLLDYGFSVRPARDLEGTWRGV